MDYGSLIGRAWDILWNNKWLVLLGILVALGGGGPGGGGSGYNFGGNFSGDFDTAQYGEGFEGMPDLSEEELQQFLDEFLPVAGIGLAILIPILCIALIIGIVLWAIGNIARGGLIAGVNQIETEGVSQFGEAWRAGWEKGWRLIGIGLIPAIPGLVLLLVGLALGVAIFGVIAATEDTAAPVAAGVGMIITFVAIGCLVALVSLALSVLRTFADRACMLEDTGVFESYRRGWEVLRDNFGPALILFLIQVGISIGLGILMLVPSIIMTLCCLLWPLLWVINGTIVTFFSTLWTLAWREWVGGGISGIEQAPAV